jgi:hypothetical protein
VRWWPLSCPSCGATLAAEPVGAPLRCTRCSWRLIALEEWKTLSPFSQGYALYMQGSWSTSELKDEKNPYAKDSPKWIRFRQGEQQAMLDAQDGDD